MNIAFWACLINSTVWLASAQPWYLSLPAGAAWFCVALYARRKERA